MIYFTSDAHISHYNIIKYCSRPFTTTEEMNETLLNNINSVCSVDDTLYHVGDFVFKSKYREWERKIKPKVIFIKGNHDKEEWPTFMNIGLNQFECFVAHEPPGTVAAFPDFTDIVICGHVHNQWKTKVFQRMIGEEIQIIPMINVSVENWQYKPMSKNKLLQIAKDTVYEAAKEIYKKNPEAQIIPFGV